MAVPFRGNFVDKLSASCESVSNANSAPDFLWPEEGADLRNKLREYLSLSFTIAEYTTLPGPCVAQNNLGHQYQQVNIKSWL